MATSNPWRKTLAVVSNLKNFGETKERASQFGYCNSLILTFSSSESFQLAKNVETNEACSIEFEEILRKLKEGRIGLVTPPSGT